MDRRPLSPRRALSKKADKSTDRNQQSSANFKPKRAKPTASSPNLPGEFQTAARTAANAAESTAASATTATEPTEHAERTKPDKPDPRTFQAAYDAGKEALSSYNSAKLAISERREQQSSRPCRN